MLKRKMVSAFCDSLTSKTNDATCWWWLKARREGFQSSLQHRSVCLDWWLSSHWSNSVYPAANCRRQPSPQWFTGKKRIIPQSTRRETMQATD